MYSTDGYIVREVCMYSTYIPNHSTLGTDVPIVAR